MQLLNAFQSYLLHSWLAQWRRGEDTLFLITDGHASRFSHRVFELALELNIVLFFLPPNSSHVLQPLDRLFGAVHERYAEVCSIAHFDSY